MKQKICKEKCIYCKSAEYTVYKNKNQCYCKSCEKYFKPGSKRNEYSATSALVLNTIISLFYPTIKKFSNFRKFVKLLKAKSIPTIHNVKIEYIKVPKAEKPTDTRKLIINGNLKDSIILTRTSEGFIVTSDLDVRQKIRFNDFIINTYGPQMKNDYYLNEKFNNGE